MPTSTLMLAARWVLASAVALALPSSPAAGELVYVALGEQTPLGMQAGDPARIAELLERSGRRVRLVDLTSPRTTSAEIRRAQLARVIALRPFLVTLAIGSAEACEGTPLGRFARDLETIADLLHRNSPNVIVSTFAVPGEGCSSSGHALRRRADAFNWAILRATRRNRLSLADLGGGAVTPRAWREVVEGKVALLFPRLSRVSVGELAR